LKLTDGDEEAFRVKIEEEKKTEIAVELYFKGI
jgi:hypothetical protein